MLSNRYYKALYQFYGYVEDAIMKTINIICRSNPNFKRTQSNFPLKYFCEIICLVTIPTFTKITNGAFEHLLIIIY